ncbi:hypothetical protein PBY51_013658 [Eleginops maclovinus]|uniref:Uncharacterized protein n=1 Tax=Eleginops maclovinus TaxID=56733 RepID=A0AAN7Y6J6_ELEMC|nr:hypothetical protein PBY51_013658 [Eleginops maclovinus]
MIEGPEPGDCKSDVMWHLAGEPPGGQAVRRTDSQLSGSQVRLLEEAAADGEAHSQLSFSVTHCGTTEEEEEKPHACQICTK